ncbi:unknown [Firmicutes bacterium CAG:137]|nr:unknown [Firmicutes bacterium CAG:137]
MGQVTCAVVDMLVCIQVADSLRLFCEPSQ